MVFLQVNRLTVVGADRSVDMLESKYKSFDELPLFLNYQMIADILGISRAVAYQLMREDSFPTLRIGKRMVVPKDRFIAWLEATTSLP